MVLRFRQLIDRQMTASSVTAWFLCLAVFFGISFLGIGNLSIAQDDSVDFSEYKVKYAFLWGQTRYIRWPGSTPGPTFKITFLKAAPHQEIMEAIASKRKIQERDIQLFIAKDISLVDECDVLFIPKLTSREEERLALEKVRGMAVLTVGESSSFCADGGVLGYSVNEKGTIDFELNPFAAKRQGLTIDARLTRLAHVLTPEDADLNRDSPSASTR